MTHQDTSRRPLFLRLMQRRSENKEAPREAFCAQTFPHLDAVYTDAFCLTGSRAEAAALVLEAYVRAFQGYAQFQRRRVPAHERTRRTLAWLYENLHAAFCDGILAQAGLRETGIGG